MQTIKSIESQILVLERKLVNCVVDGKLTKEGFAICGKINKLKKSLAELKNEQWLGQ